MITKKHWREYFTSKKAIMEYDPETAKAEFDKLQKTGMPKLNAALYISMKKRIAIANGNIRYEKNAKCGSCFMLRFECRICIVEYINKNIYL